MAISVKASISFSLTHDTHSHIFKLTDVSVSAECSFIINLDSAVEWVDVPLLQSKSQSDCCSNSASGAINSYSLTAGEPAAQKKSLSSGREWLFFSRSLADGVHRVLPVPTQIHIWLFNATGHIAKLAIKSYDDPGCNIMLSSPINIHCWYKIWIWTAQLF